MSVDTDEVLRTLDRVEKKLDKVTDDHEMRLRKLERWSYAVPPTLILAAASILSTLFSKG